MRVEVSMQDIVAHQSDQGGQQMSPNIDCLVVDVPDTVDAFLDGAVDGAIASQEKCIMRVP